MSVNRRAEQATADALRDGWPHTGDLGCVDEATTLWTVGQAGAASDSYPGRD